MNVQFLTCSVGKATECAVVRVIERRLRRCKQLLLVECQRGLSARNRDLVHAPCVRAIKMALAFRMLTRKEDNAEHDNLEE